MTIIFYLSLIFAPAKSNPWIPAPTQTCYIVAEADGTMHEVCPVSDPAPEPLPTL